MKRVPIVFSSIPERYSAVSYPFQCYSESHICFKTGIQGVSLYRNTFRISVSTSPSSRRSEACAVSSSSLASLLAPPAPLVRCRQCRGVQSSSSHTPLHRVKPVWDLLVRFVHDCEEEGVCCDCGDGDGVCACVRVCVRK